MKNNFPHVFSPLAIRGMTLKNRVVMMPMEVISPDMMGN